VENDVISGDIFISIDRIKENAIQFSTTMENELNRVLVHGILHLLGYNDKIKKDKALMTVKEDYYLNVLNAS
jgi:rRNA maturation RNase YbeY